MAKGTKFLGISKSGVTIGAGSLRELKRKFSKRKRLRSLLIIKKGKLGLTDLGILKKG